MHVAVILAGASVAILALSDYENIGKQLYGLIMLPVAVSFLVYAMYQCEFEIWPCNGIEILDAHMQLRNECCDCTVASLFGKHVLIIFLFFV